jgi:phosphoglycerate dehydrogenase-like enzyme
MKDGVFIINNSRGPLIVEWDLAEALENGKVYARRTGCGGNGADPRR